MPESIAILDFGSQYTQLIARRVREHHVYCEILPFNTSAAELSEKEDLKGVILSGGPSGVYESEAPGCDEALFDMGVPILGICYGLHLGCKALGAIVQPAAKREYGKTSLEILSSESLFHGIEAASTSVWMSHGDRVENLNDDFEVLARTSSSPYAAVRHKQRAFFGLQFHPEVTHTPKGSLILKNFLYRACECIGDWTLSNFIEQQTRVIREQVGDAKVVCGLSGGVDSSVVAILLHRAIGDQLSCVFVNNGVLRKGESDQVLATFREHYNLNLHYADASESFLEQLSGVTDPEKKRIRIGHEFIRVFRDAIAQLDDHRFLAQGTLYPDVIESQSPFGGPSATIKSHHNVGGLPDDLDFELLEPLKYLFKDEVRELGAELGLPDELIHRQPFPGPGLAVRIVGEVTREHVEMLQEADAILQEEMVTLESYRDIWQSFAVLLPIKTVGVMGDKRTYESVIAIRCVESTDGMTANWVDLPADLLTRISSRICNEVQGVNRVVYDISSKPPSTIEWE
jgi:GMP synthase (glutamine-hydrolysing)